MKKTNNDLQVTRKKTVPEVIREYQVYDEDDNLLLSSPSAKEIMEKLDIKSSSYISANKNTGNYFKPNKNADSMIRIDYTKTKIVKTIERVEPFTIKEKDREEIVDLEGEVWKQIPGVPSCNYASNLGRFKVIDVEGNTRYNTIILCSNNARARKYRDVTIVNPEGLAYRARAPRVLVKTFIDENFPIHKVADEVVDHIDNDPLNDVVTNLRPTTQSKNLRYARYDQKPDADYSIKVKKVRCVETGEVFESAAEASRFIGAKKAMTVANAANPNQNIQTAGGYHWEYVEDNE